MPLAKVFHHNAGWLKAEGEADFSDCWERLRHSFFFYSAALPPPSHFHGEDDCHGIYFSPASLVSTPWKHDILGDGATVFYKLANPPRRRLYSHCRSTPWCVSCLHLFIPPTHARTQVHVHSSELNTKMQSSDLFTPESLKPVFVSILFWTS